jgi:hypothetical protein
MYYKHLQLHYWVSQVHYFIKKTIEDIIGNFKSTNHVE